MITKKIVFPLISSIVFTTNSYGVINENVTHLNNDPCAAADCSEPEPELFSNSSESDDEECFLLSNKISLGVILPNEQIRKYHERLKKEAREIEKFIEDDDPLFLHKLKMEVHDGQFYDNHLIIKTKSYVQEYMNKNGLKFSIDQLESLVATYNGSIARLATNPVDKLAAKIIFAGGLLAHLERALPHINRAELLMNKEVKKCS